MKTKAQAKLKKRLQTWKNQICANLFILPSISFVKAIKRLVQEQYIELRLCKLFMFFRVLKTEGIRGTERKPSAVNNENMKVD